MKKWLAEFRISTALDTGEAPQGKLPRDKSASDEVRRAEESMRSLDRRLKAARPKQAVPAALHAAVMRAVRAAAESQEGQCVRWSLRWLPAPALALLMGLGLWWSLRQPPQESPPLAAATTALVQSHEIAQKAPNAALAPLTQEMNNLNRDLQNAVEFIAANVP